MPSAIACIVRGSYPGISRPLTWAAKAPEPCPTTSAAAREPSASSGPSPSPEPISASARSSAAPSPKRSHGASSSPRSAHSIAQATVPPAEMVSMPRSSHSPLAARTTSGSETPHIGPSAETFWCSMRTVRPPPSLPLRSYRCSQPIEHDAHEDFVTSRACESSSELSCTAPSKVAAVKLRVGSVDRALKARTLAIVPSSRYFAVARPRERSRRSLAASRTPAGSAGATFVVAWTASALTCLAPITAPRPPRPAWRPSWEMVA